MQGKVNMKNKSSKSYLDLNNWNRKEHYDFFRKFDNPTFSITANIDCTAAYHYAKERNIHFYPLYLYLSLKVINQIEALRYRLEEDNIAVYQTVNGSSTVLRDDHSIGFTYLPYNKDFDHF